MAQSPETRDARRGEPAATQRMERIARRPAGYPNNGDACSPRCGGEGVDGHGRSFLAASACMIYSRMPTQKKRIVILTGCRVSGHSQKSKTVNGLPHGIESSERRNQPL